VRGELKASGERGGPHLVADGHHLCSVRCDARAACGWEGGEGGPSCANAFLCGVVPAGRAAHSLPRVPRDAKPRCAVTVPHSFHRPRPALRSSRAARRNAASPGPASRPASPRTAPHLASIRAPRARAGALCPRGPIPRGRGSSPALLRRRPRRRIAGDGQRRAPRRPLRLDLRALARHLLPGQPAQQEGAAVHLAPGAPSLARRRCCKHARPHLLASPDAAPPAQTNSVEINTTFYGMQRPPAFKKWAEETPEDFVFAVKGPK
jgi:hypothetical protein